MQIDSTKWPVLHIECRKSLANKIASAIVGSLLFFCNLQPIKAQDVASAIDLMTTYWTYLQTCARWTGGLSDEQTNRVIAVATSMGFQMKNREYINLIAAKSIERSRLWQTPPVWPPAAPKQNSLSRTEPYVATRPALPLPGAHPTG